MKRNRKFFVITPDPSDPNPAVVESLSYVEKTAPSAGPEQTVATQRAFLAGVMWLADHLSGIASLPEGDENEACRVLCNHLRSIPVAVVSACQAEIAANSETSEKEMS